LPRRTYIIVAAAAGNLVSYGISHKKLYRITKKLIQNQKEFASRCDDLRICVLDSLPDRVHRLVIIPDVALVQLDHYVEGLASRFLIWVLQQGKDKVLQLFIDYVVFRVFVKLFQVCYYDAVEVLAE
jgi:hypothetical protein